MSKLVINKEVAEFFAFEATAEDSRLGPFKFVTRVFNNPTLVVIEDDGVGLFGFDATDAYVLKEGNQVICFPVEVVDGEYRYAKPE